MSTAVSISRPKRWDIPFAQEQSPDGEMTDLQVEELLSVEPFSKVDPSGFKKNLALYDILKNDCRLVKYDAGDIIIRRGDWGNSAFYIRSGNVRVEIEPLETSMPPAMLGRRESKKRTLFETIAQLWRNHREPEYRSQAGMLDDRIGTRGTSKSPRLFLQDIPAVLDEYRTATIESGQWVGELAALGRTPRSATVFADAPCELLEIRWQGLRDIMRHDKDKSLQQLVEDAFRNRALSAFLRNEPIFQKLDEDQLQRLVNEAEFETYGNYDSPEPFLELAKRGVELNLSNEPFVAREGDYPNGVILIRSGLARLSQKHHHGARTVGYLVPGQSFGFPEIAEGWQDSRSPAPLKWSLTAIGYLNVVVIPTLLVEELLLKTDAAATGPASAVPSSKNSISRERDRASQQNKSASPTPDDHLLNFLVDRRYVQGTASMVIDLNRCTRCDDCVRACASTHDNNPRFIRHGPVYGQYMMANACLHCTDPVCMIECPTGAIHRDQTDGLIVINEQTCIGCYRCANNCSYDAIRMVEIRDTQGAYIVDEKNKPLVQATKCDLCQSQLGGPACEQACPHDALFRLDMTRFETMEAFLQS